jgi:hypothetical protein
MRAPSIGHLRPCRSATRSDAEQRGDLQTLYADLDRLAEAQWPADRESACRLCRCSYYLGTVDLTAWKRLVEGGQTEP